LFFSIFNRQWSIFNPDMHVRKFQGKTAEAALKKAKEELGDDAIIIQTRPVKSGRLRSNSFVEIIVASDNEAPSELDAQSSKWASPKADTIKQIVDRANTILTASNYDRQANRRASEGGREGQKLPTSERENVEGEDTGGIRTSDNSKYMLTHIGSELSEIRDVLHILLNGVRLEHSTDLPEIVQGIYKSFINNDLEPDIAYDLARGMEDCFNNDDGPSIQTHLSFLIGKLIKIAGGINLPVGESTKYGETSVVALIGPTGVGKTTTIAKLAAQYKIKQKKRVLLMTIDNYRIAAINQLKTYAEIISAPLAVATEPEELAQKISEQEEADLILLDTPGRSQLAAMKLRELEAFLNAARPTETHLLISSTMRNEDMYSVLDRFGSVGVDRLIFTKLDEATCFGTILNASVKSQKPISYLTTGQDVSSDIELARPERIANFLLRGLRK